ncbi:hypothetical protein ACTMU2_23295 [Cupriavidus basilensis]
MQDRASAAAVGASGAADTPECEFRARAGPRDPGDFAAATCKNLRAQPYVRNCPNASALRLPALHYGLAFVEQRLGRYPAAEQELARIAPLLVRQHPGRQLRQARCSM